MTPSLFALAHRLHVAGIFFLGAIFFGAPAAEAQADLWPARGSSRQTQDPVCVVRSVISHSPTEVLQNSSPPASPSHAGPAGRDARAAFERDYPPPLTDQLWARGEYLLWWTQGAHLPPLVTTSPDGTPRAQAGVLGQDTSILLGETRVMDDARSGSRITLGKWLRPGGGAGIQASYLGTGRETARFRFSSTGTPILARPFFNTQTEAEDSELIAFGGVAEGSMFATATTEFQAVEVLLRETVFKQRASKMDFLIGWRFGRLDDNLSLMQTSTSTDPLGAVPVGTTVGVLDLFDTKNVFQGAELGVVFQSRHDRWGLELVLKTSLGNTESRVVIDGGTTITAPGGGTVVNSGGLLAQQTNIGRYEESHFAVIPELGFTLSYDLSCRLQATLGYTFIYWSQVVRPGDQIDQNLNPSQFPPGALVGAPRPEFSFVTTDFLAQGLNFGLEYRF